MNTREDPFETNVAEDQARLYYYRVDQGDIEGVLDLFEENAVYHRPGYPPMTGRGALDRFYRYERMIVSGEHRIESLVVSHDDSSGGENLRVVVQGMFEGKLKNGDRTRLRFADFFSMSHRHLIQHRQTYFFTALV